MAIRNKGDFRKIILLILAIIAFSIAGLLIVDTVGRTFGISVPLPGLNYIRSVAFKKTIKQSEDPYLMEREELSKDSERVSLKEEQVLNREKEILAKEVESKKKLEAVLEKEKELDQRQQLIENRDKQWQDRKKNIREQAVKLYNMPPKDAVSLMEKQTDNDVVDILREIDAYSAEIGKSSTSPYMMKLLGEINRDKAASVLRKLKYSADGASTAVETLENSEIPPPP
jgi:hypothetical protein